MFAESPTIDPTFVILILAVIVLVLIGLIALAFFGVRMAHRAASGRAPMTWFYAVLAVEMLIIVAFGFAGGVVSLVVALTLLIEVAVFMAARRSKD